MKSRRVILHAIPLVFTAGGITPSWPLEKKMQTLSTFKFLAPEVGQYFVQSMVAIMEQLSSVSNTTFLWGTGEFLHIRGLNLRMTAASNYTLT